MDLQDLLQVWIWTVTACLHHLQEIWDQDQMGQWDHLQEQKADLWDLLQVKADHLQEIWQDQGQTGQWDHLQVNRADQWLDQTDQWGHLQVNRADRIHCLVKVDHKEVQDQMDRWDHLQEIWVITWDHLQEIWDQEDHLQDRTLWQEWKPTWLMQVTITDRDQMDQDQMDLLCMTCLQVICLLHQMTIPMRVAKVCKLG